MNAARTTLPPNSRLESIQRAAAALTVWLVMAWPVAAATHRGDTIALPELGESGAGLMTPAKEDALGQAWLRSFRASVRLYKDPLLYEYLENLLFELASYSELTIREFDLVVIDNPTINAFAVPGRVIGVHTGLFLHAESEAQLASVLAHELAHLSQRHFARSIEAAKRGNFVSLAGLLAGVVLAASGGGDAATAAIVGSQAAALDSQLRYSRLHEKEADRAGMKTLVSAGYPPSAVADMFRQMLDAARLNGSNIPEFLRTHPVTESRVTDASNRARQLAQHTQKPSIDYALMRARIEVLGAADIGAAITDYQKRLHSIEKASKGNDNTAASESQMVAANANRYGLALALYQNKQYALAKKTIAPLLQHVPGRIPYALLDIEIDAASGQASSAERRLRDLNALIPNNYAIGMLLAEQLARHGSHQDAATVLLKLATARPQQADSWYQLAEVQGQAGNIVELHQARAEFFVLRANFQQARKQLQYALKISNNNYLQAAKIKQRIADIAALELAQKSL